VGRNEIHPCIKIKMKGSVSCSKFDDVNLSFLVIHQYSTEVYCILGSTGCFYSLWCEEKWIVTPNLRLNL